MVFKGIINNLNGLSSAHSKIGILCMVFKGINNGLLSAHSKFKGVIHSNNTYNDAFCILLFHYICAFY